MPPTTLLFPSYVSDDEGEFRARIEPSNFPSAQRHVTILVDALELRADGDQPPVLEGYAALFNKETQIGGDLFGWRETIKPGAFTQSIGEDDILALFNHNEDAVLGRSGADTLALREDKKGLHAMMTPPDTVVGRDLVTLVRRGDISGMSFAFLARKQQWDEPKKKGQLPLRTLLNLQLFDVSVVTYPAYPQTSVSARDQARVYAEASAHGRRAVVAAQVRERLLLLAEADSVDLCVRST